MKVNLCVYVCAYACVSFFWLKMIRVCCTSNVQVLFLLINISLGALLHIFFFLFFVFAFLFCFIKICSFLNFVLKRIMFALLLFT